MNIPIFPDRYSSHEAANILGVAPETLAIWRCTKRYPVQGELLFQYKLVVSF